MGLSFGIYKSKLLFFIGIIVFLSLAGYYISGQLASASLNEIYSFSNSGDYVINLEVKSDSTVMVNGKKIPRLLEMTEIGSELRYIAVEEAGLYINHLTINVSLPKDVKENEVRQIIYAVHGVESSRYYQKDSQTFVYEASNLGPMSTFTVVAGLPQGMVEFSWWDRLVFSLSHMNPYLWLGISLALPVLAMVMLLVLYAYKLSDWRFPKIKAFTTIPPSELSPAEVEVLLHGKVSARSIAATLIDLAQRGYIYIVQKDGDFSFGKRKPLDFTSTDSQSGLRVYEKILLSKVFDQTSLSSQRKDILMRIGRHIFSRKVAEVYYEIYQSVSAKGYFVKDPSVTHRRYRQLGIGGFFLGILGFTLGIWLAPDPKYVLVFWGMMIVACLIIIKLSPQLPARVDKGRRKLVEWIKFKNFLISDEPIEDNKNTQELFSKFLPYAISMGVEVEWAKRFAQRAFSVPEWYATSEPLVLVEDFANRLYSIIGFASYALAAAKEPGVQ